MLVQHGTHRRGRRCRKLTKRTMEQPPACGTPCTVGRSAPTHTGFACSYSKYETRGKHACVNDSFQPLIASTHPFSSASSLRTPARGARAEVPTPVGRRSRGRRAASWEPPPIPTVSAAIPPAPGSPAGGHAALPRSAADRRTRSRPSAAPRSGPRRPNGPLRPDGGGSPRTWQ